jgi:hypothetical protein
LRLVSVFGRVARLGRRISWNPSEILMPRGFADGYRMSPDFNSL